MFDKGIQEQIKAGVHSASRMGALSLCSGAAALGQLFGLRNENSAHLIGPRAHPFSILEAIQK